MDDYTEEQKRMLVDCCPTKVFTYDENARSVFIEEGDASRCIFCKECTYTLEDFRKTPEESLGVTIQHSRNKFTFTVETTGALTASQVVSDALEVLMGKINKLIDCNQKIVGAQ